MSWKRTRGLTGPAPVGQVSVDILWWMAGRWWKQKGYGMGVGNGSGDSGFACCMYVLHLGERTSVIGST